MPLHFIHLRTWGFCLGLCCLAFGSCKKLLEVAPPQGLTTAETVFSNDTLARAGVTGIYIQIMSQNLFLLNGGMSVYPALSSDELRKTFFQPEELQFFDNNLSPDNGFIKTNFWRSGYAIIYQANICLERLNHSSKISAPLKKQLIGETKFVRALCYYYLIQLFGEVPLLTTSDWETNSNCRRSPIRNIYQLILADLEEAWFMLALEGPNIFPTKMAAAALLARVHCHLENWEAAELFSSAVLDANKYELHANPSIVFLAESHETILQFAPVQNINCTSEGAVFIPALSTSLPQYVLTDSLLAAFTAGDLRKAHWTESVVVNGDTLYYPRKYKVRKSSAPATEYNVALRLAEQYLIRAEARIRLEKYTEGLADLNEIRGRAGLMPISIQLSTQELLLAIEKEKRLEFFVEWGHRWIDLKRTNRVHEILAACKGNKWQMTDHLFPIPLSEIELNRNLTQNPGY